MRYGRRIVIVGLLLALLGLVLSILVAILHEYNLVSAWWLTLTLSFVGIAQGLVISPNQALTLADVPLTYAGSSGAILQTGQRIGTSIGIAIITAATFGSLEASGSWATAMTVGLSTVVLVVLLTLGMAIKDLRNRG